MNKPTPEDIHEFVQYVLDFYGKKGIYCMNANLEQVTNAVETYLKICELNCIEFTGDSIDRENVRDLLIRKFGLKFPKRRAHS
jgi:hypothetical protein